MRKCHRRMGILAGVDRWIFGFRPKPNSPDYWANWWAHYWTDRQFLPFDHLMFLGISGSFRFVRGGGMV
ncbi:MAG: hypothetical protein ACPHL6_00205 [Rubripirellula sp.]